jgi:hypothetical protein
MARPQQTERRAPFFAERAKDEIISKLNTISQFMKLEYEFTEDEGLRLSIEEEETIYFSHPNSAMAYLDGFLLGYDFGFGDGREDQGGGKNETE